MYFVLSSSISLVIFVFCFGLLMVVCDFDLLMVEVAIFGSSSSDVGLSVHSHLYSLFSFIGSSSLICRGMHYYGDLCTYTVVHDVNFAKIDP
ncbi:hypothetical protein Hanom_Chr07g00602101 [Helianthus anomalus]